MIAVSSDVHLRFFQGLLTTKLLTLFHIVHSFKSSTSIYILVFCTAVTQYHLCIPFTYHSPGAWKAVTI